MDDEKFIQSRVEAVGHRLVQRNKSEFHVPSSAAQFISREKHFSLIRYSDDASAVGVLFRFSSAPQSGIGPNKLDTVDGNQHMLDAFRFMRVGGTAVVRSQFVGTVVSRWPTVCQDGSAG